MRRYLWESLTLVWIMWMIDCIRIWDPSVHLFLWDKLRTKRVVLNRLRMALIGLSLVHWVSVKWRCGDWWWMRSRVWASKDTPVMPLLLLSICWCKWILFCVLVIWHIISILISCKILRIFKWNLMLKL